MRLSSLGFDGVWDVDSALAFGLSILHEFLTPCPGDIFVSQDYNNYLT